LLHKIYSIESEGGFPETASNLCHTRWRHIAENSRYTSQTHQRKSPTTSILNVNSKQAKASSTPTCGTPTSESSRTPFCVRLYPLVETGERTSTYLTAPLIKQCSTERGKRIYGTQNTSFLRITSYVRYHRKFYTCSLKRIKLATRLLSLTGSKLRR